MAVSYPHESLIDSHQDGATEGWIAEVVSALVKAKQADARPLTVVELGGFVGTTTAWLALALAGEGKKNELIVSEPDAARRRAIEQRLDSLGETMRGVTVVLSHTPSPQIIHNYGFRDGSIDVAWIDDDHQKHHVEQEINALWPKMKPGGLMLFHDVASDGVCQLGPLIRKYGGIAMDLPRLGPDGGLGIIPIPK